MQRSKVSRAEQRVRTAASELECRERNIATGDPFGIDQIKGLLHAIRRHRRFAVELAGLTNDPRDWTAATEALADLPRLPSGQSANPLTAEQEEPKRIPVLSLLSAFLPVRQRDINLSAIESMAGLRGPPPGFGPALRPLIAGARPEYQGGSMLSRSKPSEAVPHAAHSSNHHHNGAHPIASFQPHREPHCPEQGVHPSQCIGGPAYAGNNFNATSPIGIPRGREDPFATPNSFDLAQSAPADAYMGSIHVLPPPPPSSQSLPADLSNLHTYAAPPGPFPPVHTGDHRNVAHGHNPSDGTNGNHGSSGIVHLRSVGGSPSDGAQQGSGVDFNSLPRGISFDDVPLLPSYGSSEYMGHLTSPYSVDSNLNLAPAREPEGERSIAISQAITRLQAAAEECYRMHQNDLRFDPGNAAQIGARLDDSMQKYIRDVLKLTDHLKNNALDFAERSVDDFHRYRDAQSPDSWSTRSTCDPWSSNSSYSSSRTPSLASPPSGVITPDGALTMPVPFAPQPRFIDWAGTHSKPFIAQQMQPPTAPPRVDAAHSLAIEHAILKTPSTLATHQCEGVFEPMDASAGGAAHSTLAPAIKLDAIDGRFRQLALQSTAIVPRLRSASAANGGAFTVPPHSADDEYLDKITFEAEVELAAEINNDEDLASEQLDWATSGDIDTESDSGQGGVNYLPAGWQYAPLSDAGYVDEPESPLLEMAPNRRAQDLGEVIIADPPFSRPATRIGIERRYRPVQSDAVSQIKRLRRASMSL